MQFSSFNTPTTPALHFNLFLSQADFGVGFVGVKDGAKPRFINR
jgi:hypothetical protein